MPLRRKRKRSQSETDEGGPAPSPEVRKDPFRSLCWDCGSIILSYLDVRDLAQCERVDKGWRQFIHEWMGAVGLCQHFPDYARSKLKMVHNAKDSAPVFKEYAVNDAVRTKWTSGSASCVREYDMADGGAFETRGDFAAWIVGGEIFWQRLGFRSDGSLHPVQKVELDVPGSVLFVAVNELGYLYVHMGILLGEGARPDDLREIVLSLETGEQLWMREMDANYTFVALGRDRIYCWSTEGEVQSLVASDLQSGNILYRARREHWLDCVTHILTIREHGGDELLLMDHHVEHEGATPAAGLGPTFHVAGRTLRYEGLALISGRDGQQIQIIDSRLYSFMEGPGAGEFAVAELLAPMRWRIHKYTQDTGALTFTRTSTEAVDGSILGSLLEPSKTFVDPYRSIASKWDPARWRPCIMSILPNPTPPDIDAGEETSAGSQQTTLRWSCLGPMQDVTLPPRREREPPARRAWHITGPESETWWNSSLHFIGPDRLLFREGTYGRAFVFDFGFRRPQPLDNRVGKDQTTMEI